MVTGWDKSGPNLFYVDSDGSRLKGDIFSVGSGSTFAYGVLDSGYDHDLSVKDALELGRRSIYHATHRDAMSGGSVNCKLYYSIEIAHNTYIFCIVYHVTEEGWTYHGNHDVGSLHWDYQDGVASEII